MPTNGLYFIHYCLYYLLTLLTTIGVIKANESSGKIWCHFELAEDWAHHHLKSIEWVKGKWVTEKVKQLD